MDLGDKIFEIQKEWDTVLEKVLKTCQMLNNYENCNDCLFFEKCFLEQEEK